MGGHDVDRCSLQCLEPLVTITAPPADPVHVETVPHRQLRIRGRSYGLVPPNIRDPRIHLAVVTLSIFVLGITWLGFQVSIAQILVTMLTCATIEVAVTSPAHEDARVAGKRVADGEQHRAVLRVDRHRER